MLQYSRWAATARLVFRVGLAFMLGGCGEKAGQERAVVSGTIKYMGKPIPAGQIQFLPDANSPVPSAGADVNDGQYTADVHGGVCVGTYKVEITAHEKPPTPLKPEWEPNNFLPKCYGADSQLRITIKPGDRNVVQDFDLRD